MTMVDDDGLSPLQEGKSPRRVSGDVPGSDTADPEQAIASISALTLAERQQLLVDWNDTKRDYPRETPLAALVEAQVERTPNEIAVVYGDRQLTYAELNQRANQVARELRKQGAGPNQLVGLCVDRSIGLIVGLLAIVKAGAAYLPLDPLLPAERLGYMLEDSGVQLLITEKSIQARPSAFVGATILLEDAGWQANPGDNLSIAVRPEDLAYLIYTSGSTGKPKGVQIARGALTNFLWSMRQWLELTERDRALAVATISFDIAGLEIWLPLLVGARLVIASRESTLDGNALRALMEKHDITFMQATPVTWRLLFDAGWPGKADLQVVFGGEAMPPEVAAQLVPAVKRAWNFYGPTETTICSTGYRLTSGEGPILIGRPLANTQCYILDEQQQLVPVGVTGELYIGGDGLACGYLNHPELTAEKFVADPFRESCLRMYRTGDLARYRADGNIEFLGRLDHQIKIRGYRIELGEIEAALSEQPEIEHAVVMAREDSAGSKRLAAYLVASKALESSELRNRLKSFLPDYMLPSTYIFLDRFPISLNGKIDRNALLATPEPQVAPADILEDVPLDSVEGVLARIWAEELEVPRIGIHDDFFTVGGDSLNAVRLLMRIRDEFPEFEPSFAEILRAPTVAEFARILTGGQANSSYVVKVREGSAQPPLFCVHGVGGNVFSMRDLALAMPPGLPVYSLQTRGLDGQSPPFSSVEETAECYVDEIRKVQPHGPYFLGGGCYGGLVTFEMARRLHAIGEEVGMVAMMDARNPARDRFISRPRFFYLYSAFVLRRALHHLQTLVRMRPSDWRGYFSQRAKTVLRMAGSLTGGAAGGDGSVSSMDVSSTEGYAPGGPGDWVEVLDRIEEAGRLSDRNFIPKPYNGHLLVIRPKTREDDPYRDDALGWRPLAKGGVTAYELEGDHLGLLRQPQVQKLADLLAKHIADANHNEAERCGQAATLIK
jgi:amino acid adenylation domain-containing protein